MATTNEEVARKLGVGASSVSRMRAGIRVGSPQVLLAMVKEYGLDPLEVLEAAANRNRKKWTKLWDKIFSGA